MVITRKLLSKGFAAFLASIIGMFTTGCYMAVKSDEAIPNVESKETHLVGGIGKTEILTEDVQKAIGIKCSNLQNGDTEISEVVKGSDAFSTGVHAGDRIAGVSRRRNHIELQLMNAHGQSASYGFDLRVQRNQIASTLPATAPPLRPLNGMNAQQDAFSSGLSRDNFRLNVDKDQSSMTNMKGLADSQGIPKFKGKINDTAKILANYNIDLIVDKSLSMRQRDCPGGMSRWEWCASQSQELGNLIAPLVPQGLSIIPFARFYDTHEKQQPQQIANMFYNTELELGTRLAEPLDDRIHQAINRRARGAKPTIIAVITDGVPAPKYEPQAVVDVLISATKEINNPQDISIVFFQIGSRDRFGQQYLFDLDNNLVNWGARYDLVHTVSFDQLQQYGLARSLVNALSILQMQRH